MNLGRYIGTHFCQCRVAAAVTVEDGKRSKSLVSAGENLGSNGSPSLAEAPVPATAEVVETSIKFQDLGWIGGTWDLKQFVKDGKTDWDAVIDAGRAAMIGFFMAYLVDSLTRVGLVDQMGNFFCETLLIRKNEDIETLKKLLEETTFYDKQWQATWQDETSSKTEKN